MQTSEIISARAILKTVQANTYWGIGIALAINNDAKIPRLITELKSQYRDQPEIMQEILGIQVCNTVLRMQIPIFINGIKFNIKHRLCGIYSKAKNRCFNPKNPSYVYYGGRGITMCDEWRYDKISFLKWSLANGYQSHLCLDRKDNNGSYQPDNCRWVTVAINNKNRSCTRLYEYNGLSKNLYEWSDLTGIPYSTLYNRKDRGWSVEKMLTYKKS